MGIQESIEKLSVVAARLNDATDGLTKKLEALEKKIAQTRVGVVIWLDIPMKSDPNEPASSQASWKLGYTKYGDNWRLLVSPEHKSWPPFPLLKAPRMVRVEACKMLPRLIEMLTERAITQTEGTRAAEADASDLLNSFTNTLPEPATKDRT